jgi:hypothetical protein
LGRRRTEPRLQYMEDCQYIKELNTSPPPPTSRIWGGTQWRKKVQRLREGKSLCYMDRVCRQASGTEHGALGRELPAPHSKTESHPNPLKTPFRLNPFLTRNKRISFPGGKHYPEDVNSTFLRKLPDTKSVTSLKRLSVCSLLITCLLSDLEDGGNTFLETSANV